MPVRKTGLRQSSPVFMRTGQDALRLLLPEGESAAAGTRSGQSGYREGALGAINNGMNPLEIAPCWPEAVLGVDMISAAAMGGYRARSARQKNIQRPLPPKVQQALYILLGEYRVNAGDGTRRLVLNRGQPPCYPFRSFICRRHRFFTFNPEGEGRKASKHTGAMPPRP